MGEEEHDLARFSALEDGDSTKDAYLSDIY